MTDISLSPHGAAAAKAQSNSIFRHARYVVAENPVTGVAFGLFILIALCALIGPYVVPYDPLASDTSATLASPSFKHWFGTDQLGRDIFSRVIVATRLDFTIAISSVMLVFAMGGFAGIAAGFSGWTDRIVGRISDTIMAFPLFVVPMGTVAVVANTVTMIALAIAISSISAFTPAPVADELRAATPVSCKDNAASGNGHFRQSRSVTHIHREIHHRFLSVTSSPVVGSSAMSSCGLQASATR